MTDEKIVDQVHLPRACPLCGERQCDAFNPQSLLFPSESGNKVLPRHRNYLCRHCGVVFMFPVPLLDRLVAYYNEIYRKSEYSIQVNGRHIDLPIQFPESATSFYRFRNFVTCVDSVKSSLPDVVPVSNDVMIDIGGYQGMFLCAAKQSYGVVGIVVDFNEKGIDFARYALGFHDSELIDNVYGYIPPSKARFVSLVHSLEHVDDPVRLLRHVKADVLKEGGYLYIEVPNLYGSPLNDPVHFFTYSADSLSYLLNLSGFEVVYLREAGNPHAPLTIANDELVLVCLARPAKCVPAPRPLDGVNVGRRVEMNYGRLSREAIRRQARRAGLELAKLIYYSIGHFVLEKVSKDLHGLIGRLKKITGISIH